MLSLFPSLLTYELYSPVLLRITLGIIFIFWAYGKFKSGASRNFKVLAIIEAIVGILLVIGLFTQFAAIVAAFIFIVQIIFKIKNKSFFTDGVNYYFILLVISLSLLVTGPGFLAFDLPL